MPSPGHGWQPLSVSFDLTGALAPLTQAPSMTPKTKSVTVLTKIAFPFRLSRTRKFTYCRHLVPGIGGARIGDEADHPNGHTAAGRTGSRRASKRVRTLTAIRGWETKAGGTRVPHRLETARAFAWRQSKFFPPCHNAT
jgi:hypothetical protein